MSLVVALLIVIGGSAAQATTLSCLASGHSLTAEVVSETQLRTVALAVQSTQRLGSFTAPVIGGELVGEQLRFRLGPDYLCDYSIYLPAVFTRNQADFPLVLMATCAQGRPSRHRLNCKISRS